MPFPPKIHHHKSSGQARVKYKGKHYYLGPFGSVEAEQEYESLIRRLAVEEGRPQPKGTTGSCALVSDLVLSWMRHAVDRYGSDNKEVAQYRIALLPLVRLYGEMPVGDVDAGHLEEVALAMASGSWLNAKERKHRQKQRIHFGLSQRTINRRLTRIRTVWKWAERQRLAPKGSHANLCTFSGLSATDKRVRHVQRRQPIPWLVLRKILRHLHSPVREMVLFQWWTGCRSGEVRSMKIEEIDRSGPIWIYRPAKHKTQHLGQERPILIGPRAQSCLRRFLSRDKGYVFLCQYKIPYTDFAYAQEFRKARHRAKVIEPYTPYCCRHAARMRIARFGGDEGARAVLGHKSIDTTAHYGSLDLELAAEIMRRCG